MNLRDILIVSILENFERSISSSSSFLANPISPYSSFSFSAVSIEIRRPSARSLVTCSPPIGIIPA
jgi:hypothetical protein